MSLRSTHRIAYLCSDPELELGGSGQAARSFCGLARGLRAAGTEVAPFVGSRRGTPERVLTGVRVVPPGRFQDSERVTALLDNAQAFVAAMMAAGPFDAVIEQLSFCGTAGRDFARAAAIPFVLRVTDRIWEGNDAPGSLRVANALCIDVLRDADLVSVTHDGLARALGRLGVTSSRVIVQPGGVDLDRFDGATAAPPPPAVDDGPSVLLPLERSQPTAIALAADSVEALRTRRSLSLRIATSEPESAALARARARKRPDLIHAEPLATGAALARLFRAADAVISHCAPMPGSRSDDLALFGGIAAKKPLIVGRSDETSSWTAGIPGIHFFRPCHAEDLAMALEQALDREASPWPATAERVRLSAGWTARAQSLLDALEARMSSRRGRASRTSN